MSHPILPYGNSEGNARHGSSRRRFGVHGENQAPVLALLSAAERDGCTSAEIQRALKRGHGQVSGALSALHRGGHVAMLKEMRDRQHIYVLAGNEAGRPTEPRRCVTAHNVVLEAHVHMFVGEYAAAESVLASYVNRVEPPERSIA